MKQISTKRAASVAIALFLIVQVATWLVYFAAETTPPLLIFVGSMTVLGALVANAVFFICRAPNATRFKCLLALFSLGLFCSLGGFFIDLFMDKFELETLAKAGLYCALIVVLWTSRDKEIWKNAEPQQQPLK